MSLLAKFAGLDSATREALADLRSPLDLALATLLVARDQCGTDTLTAEHMVAALEAAGVAARRSALGKALARAGNRVSRKQGDEGAVYRLMLPGQRQAQPLLSHGNLQVLRFDGTAPRSARQKITDLLAALSGTVRICDPYYGLRTLDVLDAISKSTAVRFLTARTSESGPRLVSALKDFKKERARVEFRISATPHDLHDRFVVSANSLLIIGHGLKDVGSKESFVVALDAALAGDLIRTVITSFDARWSAGTPI